MQFILPFFKLQYPKPPRFRKYSTCVLNAKCSRQCFWQIYPVWRSTVLPEFPKYQ